MTLKARIQEDMKSAMRAGEKDKLANIRMVMAAIKQREVDERIELDDPQVLSVIDKMVKQRRESITQFAAGGRTAFVLDRHGEAVAVEMELVVVLERPGRLFLLARGRDELPDRLHGDLRRDLARRVAAHPVGDHEEPRRRIREEGVLVAGPDHAGVGRLTDFELH
jgi:hypothetical protein